MEAGTVELAASKEFAGGFFGLAERGTTVQREVVAGLATFMTIAYIIFVNPQILSSAGAPKGALVAATCLGAAFMTLIMGLWANYPLALASGMGLNAAVAIQASTLKVDWQTMMGVIVVEGAVVTVLVLTRVREQVMHAIPLNLKRAIGVGIGMLIAFLGLQHMGWISKGPNGVFLTQGDFSAKTTVVATVGLLMVSALLSRKVRGAILVGILATAAVAWLGDRLAPSTAALVQPPATVLALPDFSTFGQAKVLAAQIGRASCRERV